MHIIRWIIGIIIIFMLVVGLVAYLWEGRKERAGSNYPVPFLIVAILVGATCVWVIPHGGASSKSRSFTPASTTASTTHVQAGDNAVINTADDLTATSEDSLKKLQNYVNANNDSEIQTMVDVGDVLQLPQGTHVVVDDISWDGIAHIEIKDGGWAGHEGYIPYEQLTPVKSK